MMMMMMVVVVVSGPALEMGGDFNLGADLRWGKSKAERTGRLWARSSSKC